MKVQLRDVIAYLREGGGGRGHGSSALSGKSLVSKREASRWCARAAPLSTGIMTRT